MEYLPDHIGPNSLPTNRRTVSKWNVYIPLSTSTESIDRDTYIKNCFLTNTITLINTNAEIRHKVKIDKECLQTIRFPVDASDLGSEVVCLTIPYSEDLYVIGVFDTIAEYTGSSENIRVISKQTDINSSCLIIDAINGVLSIGVRSEQNGGIVSINITNPNATAQYKLIVNGTHIVQTSGDIDFTSFNGNFNVLSKAIQLLDGSLGGLVKVIDLTTKLNNLENLVNDLISKYNSHTHILTLSSGTGTAAPTVTTETQTLTPTNRGDIENTNITHGNPS